MLPFNPPLNGGDFDHGNIMRPVSERGPQRPLEDHAAELRHGLLFHRLRRVDPLLPVQDLRGFGGPSGMVAKTVRAGNDEKPWVETMGLRHLQGGSNHSGFRIPGMSSFPCKCQRTKVSTMVSSTSEPL